MKAFSIILFFCLAQLALNAQSGEVCYNPNLVKDTSKRSINSMAIALVHGDSVKISYHSPGVRGRIIWGGLVPYGEVWVTGAHDATTITMPRAFVVGGKTIPAGKYAIFTIPGKSTWTVIINSRWNQHLASEYDAKEDLVRIQVKPKPHAHTERLQYFIRETKSGGSISIAWEKIELEFPFQFK